MTRALVTGATGFVGRAAVPALAAAGLVVRAALRRAQAVAPDAAETVVVGEIGPETDWRAALTGVEIVVHLAARVHIPAEIRAGAGEGYERVNRQGARALAEAAAAAGVRRLVFVSSVKALGEETSFDRPMRAEDAPAPVDVYGISKAKAEEALRDVAARTGLEVVILRPPLVHGPGAVGNLAALARAIARGIPLPLAGIANRRSLIHVGNLADALVLAATHAAAPGTWMLADGPPLSTPEIARALAEGVGRPARLLPAPRRLVALAARLAGRGDAAARLFGSLWVDDAPIRARLGWSPPFGPRDGLAATGRAVAAQRRDA